MFFCSLLIQVCSCKSPTVLLLEDLGKYDHCEMVFYGSSSSENIEDFKIQFKKQIRKESRRCNCDTFYVDLNDLGKMEQNNSGVYWGVCVPEKKWVNQK